MNLVAAFFVGLAVFLIVWMIGELWMSRRRPVWRPSPPGPGVQHGEYVPYTVTDSFIRDRCRAAGCLDEVTTP